MTKEPGKFEIDWYKTVCGVAHTRYPSSVFKYLSRKTGITSQGHPRHKKKKKKIWVRLFSMLMLYVKLQDPSSYHPWPYEKHNG